MSEMIERVAVAIHNSRLTRVTSWDRCIELYRIELRKQAKAAIEAMREPTEEMLIDGTQDAGAGGPDKQYIKEVFQCMIDTALKE